MRWPYWQEGPSMMGSRTPKLFTLLALLIRLPLLVFVTINLLVSLVSLLICKGMVAFFSLMTWDSGRRYRRLAHGILSAALSHCLWLHLRLFDVGGSESSSSGPESKRPSLRLVPKQKP